MSKYCTVALLAAEKTRNGQDPNSAWKKAAEEAFPDQPASQDKVCPRCAFLGLAEDGLIRGVPAGSYTQSKKNKKYALDGVELLQESPELAENPNKMWDIIMQGRKKKHNEQMFIVSALWKNDEIVYLSDS